MHIRKKNEIRVWRIEKPTRFYLLNKYLLLYYHHLFIIYTICTILFSNLRLEPIHSIKENKNSFFSVYRTHDSHLEPCLYVSYGTSFGFDICKCINVDKHLCFTF